MTDAKSQGAAALTKGIANWLRRPPPADTPALVAAPAEAPQPDEDSRQGKSVTQMLVDPARCRIWPGNARLYALLSADNCRDLIDSIIAEGEQHMPAIVRPISGDPAHAFEVLIGTRRHFSISWLRAEGYDIGFLVQVEDLDDEAAFRLADLENRSRQDVSDIERARNYAAALKTHYANHLTEMANRLKLSKGWLSKMVKVASLPDEVVSAFADPRDLRLKSAYTLAQACDQEGARAAMIATARQISRAQAARKVDRESAYPVAEIVKILLEAAGNGGGDPLFRHFGKSGKPALSVMAATRHGITLRLHSGSGVTRAELMRAVGTAIDKAAANGVTLD